MSFTVTFEPINGTLGVQPSCANFKTAREAWRQVDGLMRSDEKVTVTRDGVPISWEELRDMAERGVAPASIRDIGITANTDGKVWVQWPVSPGGLSSSHDPDEIDDLIVRLQTEADNARMVLRGPGT